MKVSVLQQYLHSLVEPLKASSVAAKVVTDLERTCLELESFREIDVAELADFLRRARTYEEQGNWPTRKAAAAPKKGKLDAAALPELANRFRASAGTANAREELAALNLTVAQIREVMRQLGISGSFKKKQDGMDKIRVFLEAPAPPVAATPARAPLDDKLMRIVEALTTLKARADAPDAPFADIEAELLALEPQLDAAEAQAAAKAMGVLRTLTNRAEALAAIRRKVLEVKLARDSIAY